MLLKHIVEGGDLPNALIQLLGSQVQRLFSLLAVCDFRLQLCVAPFQLGCTLS